MLQSTPKPVEKMVLLKYLPTLEYPITRPYEHVWVTVIAYTLGFFGFISLCVINSRFLGLSAAALC